MESSLNTRVSRTLFRLNMTDGQPLMSLRSKSLKSSSKRTLSSQLTIGLLLCQLGEFLLMLSLRSAILLFQETYGMKLPKDKNLLLRLLNKFFTTLLICKKQRISSMIGLMISNLRAKFLISLLMLNKKMPEIW